MNRGRINPVIALVDWSWMGHHPTYYRKFLDVFHSLGCEVLPVCPAVAVEEVSGWVSGTGDGPEVHTPIVSRPPRRRQRVLPAFLSGPEQAITGFGRLARQLRKWEKNSGKRISLVFFSTIYDTRFSHFNMTGFLFPYPWSGIYLHARAFRLPGSPLPYTEQMPCPEQIFTHRRMSSVCLLDEGVIGAMEKLAPGKPVIEFPDITETSPSHQSDSLAAKVRDLANGRNIVVCLGNLQKTKGLLELCEAARDNVLRDVFFFFAGEPFWGGTSAEEQARIRSVWERSPNVFTHLQRIDDTVMNDLIELSDVVFAAYTNFPNSSNVMTKAAFFRKPLVVSDGFLMAERVRKHRLGKIVPEGSVADIVHEIRHLCDHGGEPDADYSGYFAKHSPEALTTALTKVLDALP